MTYPADRSRAGSAYIVALSMATLLTVTGLSGIALLRSSRGSIAADSSMIRARSLARSGIELALARIDDDPDWRTTMAAGEAVASTDIYERAKLRVSIEDTEDDDLTNDETQSVVLTSTAGVGASIQSLRVVCVSEAEGYPVMGSALYAGDEVEVTVSSMEATSFVAAAGVVRVNGRTVSTFDEHDIDGNQMDIGPLELELPDADAAQGVLLGMAEEIDLSDIPGHTMSQVILSPLSNPYGDPNPSGVYHINCQGEQLRIADVVLRGTLILTNPHEHAGIDGAVHMEPADESMPTLVIFGDTEWSTVDAKVDTSTITGTYIHEDDAEWLAAHTESRLKGFIYARGEVIVAGPLRLHGSLVVTDDLTVTGDIEVVPPTDYSAEGLVGFIGGYRLYIEPGAWMRVTK